MIKKIITIAILSMFLLTSLTTVLADEKKSTLTNDVDDNLDIQLKVDDLVIQKDVGDPTYYYCAYVYVKNTGEKNILKSEYPNLIIRHTGEYETVESINLTTDFWEEFADDSLDVGVEVNHRIYWQYYDEEGNRHAARQGSLLKVYLDPENLIPESNEDNNYWEEVGFTARSTNQFLKTFLKLLQSHQNMFPILQILLQRLVPN